MLERIVPCYCKLILQVSNEILDRVFAGWIHARAHASLCAGLVARVVIFYVGHHALGEPFALVEAVGLARQRTRLHALDALEFHQRGTLQFRLLFCFFFLGSLLFLCRRLFLGAHVAHGRHRAVLAGESVHTLAHRALAVAVVSTVELASGNGAIVPGEPWSARALSLQLVAGAMAAALGTAHAAAMSASNAKVGVFAHASAAEALAVARAEVRGVHTVADGARFLHAGRAGETGFALAASVDALSLSAAHLALGALGALHALAVGTGERRKAVALSQQTLAALVAPVVTTALQPTIRPAEPWLTFAPSRAVARPMP